MSQLSFVGQAVVDHCFSVPALSALGGKQQASAHRMEPGGLATNAARAAFKLRSVGDPAIRLIAAVGDDADGHGLVSALQAEGLDVSAMQRVPCARTGVSAVLVDPRGERQVHNFRGDASAQAPLPQAHQLTGSVGLLVDPRWPAAAEAALRWAREHQVMSVLDAEVAPAADLQTLAPLARWVVFSAAGLAAWAGAEEDASMAGPPAINAGLNPDHNASFAATSRATIRHQLRIQRAAAACPGSEVIVTLGGQGLLWCRPGDRVTAWPAYAVPSVVDTNGAGDVFHGALLLALAQGRGPIAAVQRAMGAAALACTRAGGAAAAPSADELDHFMKDRT
jgi:sulfofructose kinase